MNSSVAADIEIWQRIEELKLKLCKKLEICLQQVTFANNDFIIH